MGLIRNTLVIDLSSERIKSRSLAGKMGREQVLCRETSWSLSTPTNNLLAFEAAKWRNLIWPGWRRSKQPVTKATVDLFAATVLSAKDSGKFRGILTHIFHLE